ncbi:MAG TPA: hypothetical protein DCR43_07135 [Bacteroidales bacterium]|nr:MAG: hypothetical protein A2X11_16605 [Bacteroidetes bacterium GWE2_42_24]OFY26334.1 MAG: hypothetical protein A2X09_00090 [Bacteroidetes bacterium GWF2_43_11]HAQ65607.1 hypothetical protein [Bacteroidales bacterium]HBZ66913.1 hypothetical protein [Bacteroidales bacterium]
MTNALTFRLRSLLIAVGLWAAGSLNAQTIVADSATMGAGYANDVYYSLDNGTVATPAAANWDIAFYTNTWSAGIITNDGRSVTLWAYPTADTSGYATLDTTGLSTWPPLYNSTESWENGAFNRNSKNHPDYGWGIYNVITHDVEGDSLFVIKTRNGMYKKLWIVKKTSILNTYHLRYADLDGSNEKLAEVNCMPYISKNFIAYDLESDQVLDREPAKETWDLLFTKYTGLYGGTIPYIVTGVLNNIGSPANRFYPVSPDYLDWSAAPFSENREVIGWDWKTFDMGTLSYTIADSLIFFDSTQAGNIRRLWFTGFAGSSSGKFYFSHQLVSGAGVGDVEVSSFNVWPNPATSYVNVDLPAAGTIIISDISGRQVVRRQIQMAGTSRITLGSLPSGMYLMQYVNGKQVQTSRILVY